MHHRPVRGIELRIGKGRRQAEKQETETENPVSPRTHLLAPTDRATMAQGLLKALKADR